MARLPQDQINRIKQDVSLLKLVEQQGFTVSKQGKDFVVHCPFHEDDTPSCVISPKTNLFHCFGCGEGGSVIDWVMKLQGLSFRRACELLLNDIGAVVDAPAKPVKRSQSKTLSSSLAADLLAAPEQSLTLVTEFYHQTLLASPEALGYLEKRGLNDPRLIKQFKLGFANRTLAYHLPPGDRIEGKKVREQLKQVGLLRDTGHEHFNGSLVVPVMSIDGRYAAGAGSAGATQHTQGNVVEMYGRKVTRKLTKGTPKHLYLPGPHAGVWNVEGLQLEAEVILCESLIDAMTFWVHGFKNVTASYGTQGFTDAHLTVFKQCGVKRVLIAYDRDQAGDSATEKVSQQLQVAGIDCFRVLFSQGLDANQFVCDLNHKAEARERLSRIIRQAVWLGNGVAPKRTVAVEENSEPASILAADVIEVVGQSPAIEGTLPPLPATPLPAPLREEIPCEVTDQEVRLSLGGCVYRVRGFDAASVKTQLKINLMVTNDNGFHADQLDLYQSKQRQVFINQACVELGVKDEVVKKDLGKVLLTLEALQEAEQNSTATGEQHSLSSEAKDAALDLLTDPALLTRILKDFDQLGLIGEESNKLVGYLACVSRKLDKPLGVVIQSSSAAGKSSLMDAILQLMPEEERVQYSAMTGQSLFYMGETNLKHKTLAIAEEEGASNASYALKLLQSEGEVTIASTGKDESTGELVTRDYRVEGPTQLFMTTTAIDIDEELMNRCLILSVDESKAQTEAIHAQQRYGESLQGVFAKATKNKLIAQHQNAQRLLKTYPVVNPYAEQLTFLSDKTRTRRDHTKYLTLIKTITLLHQYQREIKTYTQDEETLEYLEVTLSDIEQANHLVHQVLGKTLDELPPQTRNLLNQIYQWAQEDCAAKKIEQSDFRFSRRAVRQLCGWSEKQVRVHLDRLTDMEYLIVHRGGRGQSFVYELLYSGEGEQGNPFLLGLLDMQTVKTTATTVTSWGKPPPFVPPSCPHRGVVVALSSGAEKVSQPRANGVCSDSSLIDTENAPLG